MRKIGLIILIGIMLIFVLSAFSPLQEQPPPDLSVVTPESISFIAGVALSLVFSYVPGLKQKYDGIQPDNKRLIMLGSLLLTALGIYGLSCAEIYNLVACTSQGAWSMIEIFIAAALGNQTAFLLVPKFK